MLFPISKKVEEDSAVSIFSKTLMVPPCSTTNSRLEPSGGLWRSKGLLNTRFGNAFTKFTEFSAMGAGAFLSSLLHEINIDRKTPNGTNKNFFIATGFEDIRQKGLYWT